jgi:hypothetical protein
MKGLFRDEISNMSLFNGVADDITKIMTIGFKREIGGTRNRLEIKFGLHVTRLRSRANLVLIWGLR